MPGSSSGGPGAPTTFIWIDPDDELSYVRLARKLWLEWAGLKRNDVFERARERARLRGAQGDLETHPEALRCVEQICHAKDPRKVPYRRQWEETLQHTLRGFLGRQPGQRRDLGIELPDYLFAPGWRAEPKHGPWHWLLVGEALAGAIGADGLTDDERRHALERLTDGVREHDEDPDAGEVVIQRLAEMAAGPPKLGVRALVVLSRLALEPSMRATIERQIIHRAPMFRLFRAFTIMLADSAVAGEDTDKHRAALARAVSGVNQPRELNPYPGRCLRLELLARICDPRFGVARGQATSRLREAVRDREATWRERAYAGEVITRDNDGRESEELEVCLKAWQPSSPPPDDPDWTTWPALVHAAAVLVERSLVHQGLRRAVGARRSNPHLNPAEKAPPPPPEPTLEEVLQRATQIYKPDHWVVPAIENDVKLRDRVEGVIKQQAVKLTQPLYEKPKNGPQAPKKAKPDQKAKPDRATTVWSGENGITGRLRFLCEELVLSIAGTRRRRAADCLAVSGLGGLASDLLLNAIVFPDKNTATVPLWVQELGAWAVGFVRQPTPDRLEKLAKAGSRHLEVACSLDPGSSEQKAHIDVAHSALWAIGDAAGLEPEGWAAAADPTSLVSETLRAAAAVTDDPHLAPVRWAATYSLRYCLPGVEDLGIDPARDPVVSHYADLDLGWLRPDPVGGGRK